MNKSVLTMFTLAFCFSTALSAQILDYSVGRRDTIVQNNPSKTVPGNVWGGNTGMGTKWCNTTYYNGICIWRLTDATVFDGGATVQIPDADSGATVQTPSYQTDNI